MGVVLVMVLSVGSSLPEMVMRYVVNQSGHRSELLEEELLFPARMRMLKGRFMVLAMGVSLLWIMDAETLAVLTAVDVETIVRPVKLPLGSASSQATFTASPPPPCDLKTWVSSPTSSASQVTLSIWTSFVLMLSSAGFGPLWSCLATSSSLTRTIARWLQASLWESSAVRPFTVDPFVTSRHSRIGDKAIRSLLIMILFRVSEVMAASSEIVFYPDGSAEVRGSHAPRVLVSLWATAGDLRLWLLGRCLSSVALGFPSAPT